MKPLLVGQAPGPKSAPGAEPLAGRCGDRLAELCGLTPEQFQKTFARMNVLDAFPGKAGKGDLFPLPEAHRRALVISRFFEGRKVVLLGQNVCRAFLFTQQPVLKWTGPVWGATHVAVCPHPSGVSRWWNEEANLRAARRFWRKLAADCAPPSLSVPCPTCRMAAWEPCRKEGDAVRMTSHAARRVRAAASLLK